MRVVLDACVLFPTVMREMLMGAAKAGLFEPRWSSRILEEWALAARKIGPEGETIARKRVDDANSEVLMINQQLRVLPETAAYAIRRNQLLMRSANLKAEMVEHVKTTREYEVAAKNVFDAVAMRPA